MPSSNYWDSTYGRGIGGPYAGGATGSSSSPQSSSYTSYTPPSAGTQAAQQGSASNVTASDYADWAKLAYGVYRDRNPPDPKFKDVPLSPEQKQMYQIYIQSMLNPATVNNASALNQMASQMMGGLSGMKWDSPQTFSGDFGYSGSNMSFTPPQMGGAGGQWPTTGGGPMGDTPPSTQPAGSAGVRPGGGGVYGGGTHAPLPQAPSDSATGAGMDSFFSRYAGNWNQNQETYEKWLARAAAIAAAAVGFPIPANLIDKGIDAAQWIYRKVAGQKPAPLPPSSRGISDFNPPGTMDANGATPLPAPTRGLADFNPPGTRDEYGNPPVAPTATLPRQDYWSGTRTPYWSDPYAQGPAPVFSPPPGRAYGGRNNRT